jgi:hypothetical protein
MRDADFDPENEHVDLRREHASPSGRYRLVVGIFGGPWAYSKGTVFKQGTDDPVAVVKRNYHQFPFLFIEDHPSGQDFLICGYSVDLEWAVDAGPIKLVIYRDGACAGDEFFEHSTAGMSAAFAHAKDLVVSNQSTAPTV